MSLGVRPGSSYTFAADRDGVKSAYQVTSEHIAAYRSGVAVDINFTDEERAQQKR
jgi:hypothetical protein